MESFRVGGLVANADDLSSSELVLDISIEPEKAEYSQKDFESDLRSLFALLTRMRPPIRLVFQAGGPFILPEWFIDLCHKMGIICQIRSKKEETRNFFHMQMHPDYSGCTVEFAMEGLRCMNAIGLDFELQKHNLCNIPLDKWTAEDFNTAIEVHHKFHQTYGPTKMLESFIGLKKHDVVLLRGGSNPVALVEVTGPYYMEEKTYTVAGNPNCANGETVYWDWPRHRFPVKILGWYEEDQERCELDLRPPYPGTFSPLYDPKSGTYQGIVKWLRCLGL